MDKNQRKIHILKFLERVQEAKTKDILSSFQVASVERTTIYRDLKSLIDEKRITEIGRWKYKIIPDPISYLSKAFFERDKKSYNPNFLASYIPNTTFFLSWDQRTLLDTRVHTVEISTRSLHENKRKIENLLIDLSYSSSYLEGNTYSYLDTEVLINFNEIAENKLQEETQMILNHKKSIEYLLHFKNDLKIEKKTFFELHQLLWDGLLKKENLWVIRSERVDIGRSAYTPLWIKTQLEEQFEIFLEKLNAIQNPFEQSLFILVFIPYFQIFLDINKRTSRMMCNLPLLKNRLGIISLMQVKQKDYITAILAIYELGDVSLLAKIFTENYLLNLERYI